MPSDIVKLLMQQVGDLHDKVVVLQNDVKWLRLWLKLSVGASISTFITMLGAVIEYALHR